HRTPLEEIALVVPDLDPLAGLLVAALERADKGDGLSLPAYVAGGLPLRGAPSGATLLQLLLALHGGLDTEHTIAVLPHLRLAGGGLADAPLPGLWPRIRDFVREWCRAPPGPTDAAKLLDEAIADVCASRAASGLRGRDAVDYLVLTLRARRYPHGRHGEPRVFVGLPADAALLSFRAVRVLGAVEGALPGTPREDPILPDAARAWLNGWK